MPEDKAREFGGAVVWNSAGVFATVLIGIAAAMIQTRALGAAGYGRYAYLTWLAEAGGALGALGLPRPTARFMARLQREQAWTEAAWMATRAIACAGVCGGVVAVLLIAIPGVVPTPGVALRLLLALGMAGAATQAVTAAALQGGFGFKSGALVNLAGASVLLLGSVLVAMRHAGPVSQFAVAVAAILAGLAGGAFALWRLLPSGATGEPATEASAWRAPFASYWKSSALLTLIEMVVWQRSEMFFLNRFNTAEQSAYYTAAFAIAARMAVIPQLFAPILLATVGGLRYEDEAEVMKRLFATMTRWLALLCAPLYLVTAGLSPLLTRLLFGPSFRAAALPLAALLVGGLVPALSVPGSAVMYGTDRMGFALRWGGMAAVMTLLADLTLIPRYGATGAAFANLSGQTLAVGLTLFLSLRPSGFVFPWTAVFRTAAAAGVAGLVSFLASQSLGGLPGLLLGGALGFGAYVVGVRLLGALDPTDDRLFAALAHLSPAPARRIVIGLGSWMTPPLSKRA